MGQMLLSLRIRAILVDLLRVAFVTLRPQNTERASMASPVGQERRMLDMTEAQ